MRRNVEVYVGQKRKNGKMIQRYSVVAVFAEVAAHVVQTTLAKVVLVSLL